MFAITILIGITSISAFLGYLAWRTRQRAKQKWKRGLVTVLTGSASFLLGTVTFFYFGLTIPAKDDGLFDGQTDLAIEFSNQAPDPRPPASALRDSPKDTLEHEANRLSLHFVFPKFVRVNVDFPFRVQTYSDNAPAGAETLRALLETANSAPARTLDVCSAAPVAAPLTGAVAACGNRGAVSWDVTPTQGGTIRAAVRLVDFPDDDQPVKLSRPWYATISIDGARIVRDHNGSLYEMPSGRSSLNMRSEDFLPFYLTNDSPAVHSRLAYFKDERILDIDLQSMQVRAAIEVLTSLGVSEGTYSILALLGTCLAGLLGTGWLWKILGSLRARKRSEMGEEE